MLSELELEPIDFQGLDPARERGRGNAKLGRRTERSRYPASAFGKSFLDDFPLRPRLAVGPRGSRPFHQRLRARRFSRKAQLVHRKTLTKVQDHGPLNYVLQLTNI